MSTNIPYIRSLHLRVSQTVDMDEATRRRFLSVEDLEWLKNNYFNFGRTTQDFLDDW